MSHPAASELPATLHTDVPDVDIDAPSAPDVVAVPAPRAQAAVAGVDRAGLFRVGVVLVDVAVRTDVSVVGPAERLRVGEARDEIRLRLPQQVIHQPRNDGGHFRCADVQPDQIALA